ncbi:MAG: hypothetical protein M1824_003369, partial [Vezdaea acicularis]
PLPPGRDSGYVSSSSAGAALPKPSGGKEDVLASIRATGGIGGLKKVDPALKRDRSEALVAADAAGGSGAAAGASGPSGAAAGEGGMMGALAVALAARNKKVSRADSDDEEEDDDDWDETPKAKSKLHHR